MNAYAPPIRIQCPYCTSQGHPCDCESFEAADRGMSPAADRLRRSRSNMQFIAEPVEIHRRTAKLVDRICPPFGVPTVSTQYPELNASPRRWELFAENSERRKALHRLIEPRIAAKVRSTPTGEQ